MLHLTRGEYVSQSPMSYSTIKETKLQEMMQKVSDGLEGQQTTDVIAGCIAVALIANYPHLTLDQIMDGIKGASEWISAYVVDVRNADTPNMVN